MREYNHGSISKHKRASGLVWRGSIRFRDDGSKWTQVTRIFTDKDGEPIKAYPDKDEDTPDNRGKATAEKALAAWRAELIEADRRADAEAAEAARKAEEAEQRVLVADYVDHHIERLATLQAIEQSTKRDYKKAATLIRAEFADVAIQDLTTRMVEDFVLKLINGERLRHDQSDGMRSKLSVVTATKYYRVLKAALQRAVDPDHIVMWNAAAGVKLPEKTTTEKNVLDAASCARLIDFIAKGEPTPTMTGAALGLLAGLGPAEACGLRWRNVDLSQDKPSIHIEEVLGFADNGDYLKEPKCATRRRTIPIPSQLRDCLERRKKAYVEECKLAGVPLMGDMFVLGDCTGSFYSPRNLSRSWSALAESLRLKGTISPNVKFYDLRHHYATSLVKSGADVKSVSSLMGHADPMMTLRVYAQSDPEAKSAAVNRMEGLHKSVMAFESKDADEKRQAEKTGTSD